MEDLRRRRAPAPSAASPEPSRRSVAGSGTWPQSPVQTGVLLVQTPVAQTSGAPANANQGNLNPAGIAISPQSQTVPVTSPSSTTSTLPCWPACCAPVEMSVEGVVDLASPPCCCEASPL
ncbi:MAG TPA: hypothetical protein VKB86_04510 [Pyrinomonadaceae bacterium]|nr:hypothetical protein [Pyrinomonadaceae bacterium]